MPERVRNTEKIASESQQADDDSFRQRKLKASDRDLGSREMLKGEERLIWYPAEVNTSIRPGWFYHAEEDDAVRSLDELMHVYLGSVGGNGTFLLNIPPTPDGLLHENDVRRLHEIGDTLRDWFGSNLLTRADAVLTADVCEPGFEPEHALCDSYDRCFKTPDGVTEATLTMRWDEPVDFRHVVLKEDLRYSQRIERCAIDVLVDGEWVCRYEGSVVGYKRIVPLAARAQAVRVRILDSRVCPTLAFVGVYA